MIELLSIFGFWLAVTLGLVGFAALVLLGMRSDVKGADYPGGKRERIRDELLVRLPFVPAFSLLIVSGLTPALVPVPLWLSGLAACMVVGAGCRFLMPSFSHRAARLKAFHEARRALEPAQ